MTAALLLTDAQVVLADGVVTPGWLLAERGVIAELGAGPPGDEVLARCERAAGEVVHAGGRWLLPGLIDIHVHGALGHDTMDGDPATIAVIAAFHASHGVTSFLATTWTGTTDVTLRALQAVAEAMRQPAPRGATVLGAHMEGPYLNPRRCGAQEVASIRPGDREEMSRFLDVGVVRLMTIAPEVPGNREVIRQGVDHGVVMSAGHTDATYDQLCAAVAAGVRHVTHTFNAMRPLHHREPGTVGAAMTLTELTVELIADGIHVHPAAMRALFAARGADAMVLVTDAIRAAGLPSGTYPMGNRTVVVEDGAVRLPGGALAGSVLTLDRALRNLRSATGASLEQLWPTISRNAARVIGVDDRKGEIRVGLDADLVLLDEQLQVELTIVGGRIVHRATDRHQEERRSNADRAARQLGADEAIEDDHAPPNTVDLR